MTPDSVLRDRYQTLEVIGRGGQGSVVRALDRVHDRIVAVKIRPCRPGAARSEVLGEAGVLLGVRPHPLLPLVREDFFDGDRYCVVMDWVDGTDLGVHLAKLEGSGLPLDEVLDLLGQVATALDHLHGHDPPVIHGDVKPANVVRTDDGRAVLVDFGIAGGRDVDSGQHLAYGTTGYTCPETGSGAGLSVAADVFSLAATAFALLTGGPPAAGQRVPWTAIAGDRARTVELALRQGLAFDPSRRPPSAGALVEALRGRPRVRTNLPLEPTTFVGREEELTALSSLLETNRLVTLVGTAGVGKSHLSRQVAHRCIDRHPDGAHLVELEAVSDHERVDDEVRTTLGLTATPGQAAVDAVVDHLATRRALLLLDNCERLLEACSALVSALLRGCPNLTVLTTSREPLRVAGETVWRVPPMSEVDAVALFIIRARAASPNLRFEGQEQPGLRRVCRRLDYIPLALELAATRVTSLSVDELDRCLDDRLGLLTGGPRTAPSRQQTLRAALDWSHDALPHAERSLFRRLSVFAGGFTLDAVCAVVSDKGVARATLAGQLAALVDKSVVVADGLVEPDRWAGATRYRLLEALRQYGQEALEAAFEDAAIEARHLTWVRALAEEGDAGLGGPDQGAWLDTLEDELDNCRAALARTADLRLAAALGRFWEMRGHWAEGRRWLHTALEAAGKQGVEASVRARALHSAGVLAMRQGDTEVARALHDESLALHRDLDDRWGMATDILALGNVATGQGDHSRAASLYQECLDLGRAVGNRPAEAGAAANLGWLAAMQWDPQRALELLEHSLALRRQLGDGHGVAAVSTVLGHVLRNRGEYDAARGLHEDSLPIQRKLGDRHGAAWTLTHLGLVEQWQGNPAAAWPHHEEALAIRRDIGDRSGAAWSLLHLADASVTLGDMVTAGPLLDESLALARNLNDPWCINKGLTCGGRMARASGDLDLATTLFTEALAVAVEHHFDLAIATCLQALGGVASDRRQYWAAARLLGAADARRRVLQGVVHPGEKRRHDLDAASVASALGPPGYEAAFAEGAEMSVADLVRAPGLG